MIVPMKRVTILTLATERNATLQELRKAGVVHITDVQEPHGTDVDESRARLSSARNALGEVEKAVARTEPKKRRRRTERPDTPDVEEPLPAEGGTPVAPGVGTDAQGLVATIETLVQRRGEVRDRAEALRRELARVAPLGEFDPAALAALADEGVHVRIVQVAASTKTLTTPDGFIVETLGRDKTGLFLAVVLDADFDVDEIDLGAACTEVRLPEASPSRMRAESEAAESEAAELDRDLARLAGATEVLKEHIAGLEQEAEFAAARAGMGLSEDIAYLQGYVPAKDEPFIRELAAEHQWGSLLADPVPGEDVPTDLRYSKLVAPIRAVFDFLKIYPGYWEADIGWTFLVFFAIFFAMIAGDAGYALLLLTATAVLQWRLKKIPSYVFHMLYIVGAMTLVWGVLTANYFGIPSLPGFLEAPRIDWLADRDNVILLCFVIGAVHLSIAHIWNMATLVRMGSRGKAIAQFGNLLVVWSMFFLASQTVLGLSMPSFVLYMLGVGFLLIVAFMATPQEMKQSLIQHALLPLNMISNFVDVLSYIRLFAVGYASIAVVAAFTDMAASIGFDTPWTAVGAVLLLVFAHMLNLVLIGLGVLVHAVRLNTLEFSNHKGLTWAGHTLYTPFSMRKGTES